MQCGSAEWVSTGTVPLLRHALLVRQNSENEGWYSMPRLDEKHSKAQVAYPKMLCLSAAGAALMVEAASLGEVRTNEARSSPTRAGIASACLMASCNHSSAYRRHSLCQVINQCQLLLLILCLEVAAEAVHQDKD